MQHTDQRKFLVRLEPQCRGTGPPKRFLRLSPSAGPGLLSKVTSTRPLPVRAGFFFLLARRHARETERQNPKIRRNAVDGPPQTPPIPEKDFLARM